jgi:GNAT superfamily N-acetyltransferase
MGEGEVTFDGENDALHVAAVDGEQVIGCVLFDFKSGRLRAMAVEPVLQGLGIGARLVESLEREVELRGVREVRLHARADVVGFYERLGYRLHGEPFVELGIPHQAMTKAW